MKKAAAILLAITSAIHTAPAQDANSTPASFESLLSLMPKQFEREEWRSYSEERRKAPGEADLARKIKGAPTNCHQLQRLIIAGKSLSDYPGLLTLGTMIWEKDQKSYTLVVEVPMRRGEGDYGGFRCRLDQAWNVKQVSESTYVF